MRRSLPHYALLLLLSVLVLPLSSTAQDVDLTPERFAFSPELPVDDAIPSPADFLGYELGEEFTVYADVIDYLAALNEASDRITMHGYGATYEGRPLHYLVVTTAANHAQIETLQQNNQRLANPASLSADERDQLIAEQPVFTSISYNIHGNEASSTEAAMQVAYRLAAATDDGTAELLDDTVIIMYPTVNPDGRDRYVYWYKSAKRNLVATNPDDLAHDAPWPNGRTNHYLFDLNRDWVWNVHPETEGLIEAYQEWLPQVHVDYHEQSYNDNYFTMPGTAPRNQLLPDTYVAWADTFGSANTRAFDRNQITYATRESFDFFYPSYGSSYPSTMGAIGMLTEQGGIGAGRAVETSDGYVLIFRQRIFNHYTTSLETIQAAVRNRAQLLDYFVNARSPENRTSPNQAYILPDDAGNGYLYDVLATLRRHHVEVERATQSFEANAAMDYRTGDRSTRTFDAGTYLVRTDQPPHLFINTIMQRQMAIQDSVMYDMSAWSAPLAYNLDAYSTTEMPSVSTEAVDAPPAHTAGVVNPNAQYAFAIDWNQRHAPKALAKLWAAGYRVRSVTDSFGARGRDFPRGSLVVLMGRNLEKQSTARADMQRIAEEAQVQIVGLNSGSTPTGIDLASDDSRPIKMPKTALLVDEPFSTYTTGQIWYLFDEETEFPIARIRTSSLGQSSSSTYGRYGVADLNEYDVLVLPGSGWGGNLSNAFDSSSIEHIRDWVRSGGTLVATESSAGFFTESRSGLTSAETVSMPEDSVTAPPYTRYAAREDSSGLDRIPGVAFTGLLDPTHPLAFGIGEQVYSMKLSTDALEPSADMQIVGYYPADPSDVLVSGYASQENVRHLAGKVFAGVVAMGQGNVVFLVDNPHYRMFWRGPSRLMQNAVMLMPGM
jgi:hypothetical protein